MGNWSIYINPCALQSCKNDHFAWQNTAAASIGYFLCDFGVSAPIEAAADRQLSCSDRSNCCFCAGSVVALERVTHGWQCCLMGTQSGERTLNIAYTQTDINVFFRFEAKIHLVAAHMQQHSALFSFDVLDCFSNFKGCRLWSTTLTMDK